MLVAWSIGAGFWRPGSFVLALSWGIAQVHYVLTGDSVPLELYWLLDMATIAALLVWHSSRLDWLILAIFPAQWWTYDALGGVEQWWTLWALSSVQFILAGPWPGLQRADSHYSHGPLNRKAEGLGG